MFFARLNGAAEFPAYGSMRFFWKSSQRSNIEFFEKPVSRFSLRKNSGLATSDGKLKLYGKPQCCLHSNCQWQL
jgi:hypothetical protein